MSKSRTILITGANSGIGESVTLSAAKNGHQLVLLCRNKIKGDKLISKIMNEYPNAVVELHIVNLSLQNEITAWIEEFNKQERYIDVLVNNAGFLGESIHTLTEEQIELTIATNYFSQFMLSVLLINQLRNSTNPQIINVGSAMYKYGNYDLSKINDPANYKPLLKYADSKKMVTMFTGILSQKLKKEGIRVNCVDPGTVNTNIAHSYGKAFQYLYRIASPFMRNTQKGAETINFLIGNEHNLSGKLLKDKKVVLDIINNYSINDLEDLWLWSHEVAKTDHIIQ